MLAIDVGTGSARAGLLLADPKARGVISGLALDGSLDAVARLYYAGAVAIVLGTRHILDRLGEHGYRVEQLHLTGGHSRNPLLVELYADATGCNVVLGEEEDGVLLGTAMVAAAPALRQPRRGRRHEPHRAHNHPDAGGARLFRRPLPRLSRHARAQPRARGDHDVAQVPSSEPTPEGICRMTAASPDC